MKDDSRLKLEFIRDVLSTMDLCNKFEDGMPVENLL